MRRREFISLLGAVASTWPLPAHAQPDGLSAIGLLVISGASDWAPFVDAFIKGLGETGFADGRNVKIEYRWAEGHYERLPSLAADLARHRVSVIAALGTPSATAAQAATTTIPVVFTTIGDPVQLGLVSSLNHPGGNVTGTTYLNVELAPKLLEALHEVVPPGHRAVAE